MTEPPMPTTMPSPVDRGEFRFVAFDAAGTVWFWIDEELVWARQRADTYAESEGREPEKAGH